MQRTTIAVSPKVRDRLQSYGRKGMSYEEIIVSLMDLADPNEAPFESLPRHHARRMSDDEAERWRKKDPTEKLAIGERMRRMAATANPRGYRSVRASRIRSSPSSRE